MRIANWFEKVSLDDVGVDRLGKRELFAPKVGQVSEASPAVSRARPAFHPSLVLETTDGVGDSTPRKHSGFGQLAHPGSLVPVLGESEEDDEIGQRKTRLVAQRVVKFIQEEARRHQVGVPGLQFLGGEFVVD